MMPKHIKPNPKTHGRNICVFGKRKGDIRCFNCYLPSPKNRTCYCGILKERTKCVTECDDYIPIRKEIEELYRE